VCVAVEASVNREVERKIVIAGGTKLPHIVNCEGAERPRQSLVVLIFIEIASSFVTLTSRNDSPGALHFSIAAKAARGIRFFNCREGSPGYQRFQSSRRQPGALRYNLFEKNRE
jgi:hypothetical protein